MTCPWDPMRALTGVPNVDWCEASTCAWIDEPANTWSNVAYFVVAALLAWRSQRVSPVFGLARWFPIACFGLGVASFVYHASVTFGLQILDFVGMFAFLYIPLVINGERLGIVRRPVPVYLALVVGSVAVLLVLRVVGLPYQALIFVGIVALLTSEAMATRRGNYRGPLRLLLIGVAALLAGATFSALDVSRAFCDPNDHVVQGHAIWHVLTAFALYFTHAYYASLRALAPA